MPRTPKPERDAGGRPPAGAAWKWLVQVGLPLAAGGGLLAGVLWLGRLTRERLADRGGHRVAFADVELTPPPGLSRQEFLAEVQYLAGLPDRLDLLDAGTASRVGEGLARHPWVLRVRRVERLGPGRVRADLEYRVPVLAVARPPRVVDAAGVPLPAAAKAGGLPVLRTPVKPPTAPPGQAWGDVRVVAAARVAALLHPHLEATGLAGCAIDITDGEVTLTAGRTTVVWGMPPGHERTGEAPAAVKLGRLLAEGRLRQRAYDLRPAPTDP